MQYTPGQDRHSDNVTQCYIRDKQDPTSQVTVKLPVTVHQTNQQQQGSHKSLYTFTKLKKKKINNYSISFPGYKSITPYPQCSISLICCAVRSLTFSTQTTTKSSGDKSSLSLQSGSPLKSFTSQYQDFPMTPDTEKTNKQTTRANAQILHICHTCMTSSQSANLHIQPSRTFELLYLTLQKNDCTSSRFHVTLWLWVNTKLIQTGIKVYSLAVLSIVPSLKQIGSQVFPHRLRIKVYFINHVSRDFFPWTLLVQKNFSMSFSKPTSCGNRLSFIQTDT